MKETKQDKVNMSDLKRELEEAKKQIVVLEGLEQVGAIQGNKKIANLIIEALGEERAEQVADEIKEYE